MARATSTDPAAPTGPTPRTPPRPLAAAARWTFGAIATVRHQRALHPRGVALTGRAVLHKGGSSLACDREVAVAARLSRGAGLPHPIPDFNGVAVRFVDAHGAGRHQDLLLTAAGRAVGLRHLLVPAPRLTSTGYSTVLPYRGGDGGRYVFRCDPLAVATLGEVPEALPLTLSVSVAGLRGSWVPAATVTLTDLLDDADRSLRFDPWNTSDALVPAGLLNRLRAPAYEASRARG